MKRLLRTINKQAEKVYLVDILDKNEAKINGYNTDYGNRAFAISILDGRVYKNSTHKDCVEEFLNDTSSDVELNYQEGFVTPEEQDDVDVPMGFASYINGIDGKDYIAIYPQSLYNMSMDDCINTLRKQYPSAIICEDNNDRYKVYYDDENEQYKEIYIETV